MAIEAQIYNSDNVGFPIRLSQGLIDNGLGLIEFNAKFQTNQQNLRRNQPTGINPMFHSTAPSHEERQKQEIDQFISIQSQRLKMALCEQQKRQTDAFIRKLESKAIPLLKQKDEEIARVVKRSMELQDFLRKLEMEMQSWQKVAGDNEAMAMTLSNQLAEVREKASTVFPIEADDAESEIGENQGTVCRLCGCRSLCVLFLPCRHLGSCKACEGLLDSCPICRTLKKATMEVLTF